MIKDIESVIESVFDKLSYNKEYAKISYSKLPNICDFQINSVFFLTKELGLSPNEIGKNIVDKLKKYEDYFETVEFYMPGFVNLKISDKLINKHLNNEEKLEVEPKTYFIDYGGPNIAKSLHVGHMRPAIIGESLKRILKYAGHKVISDVHLGDYGLQIGEVIYGLQKEGKSYNDIELSTLERIYPFMSKLCKEDENILKECQNITYELQNGNEEYIKYWKSIYNVSLDDIKKIYNYLGISFDMWKGESDAYQYIPNLLKYLESKNMISVSEGAKVIEVKEKEDTKEMPPLILEKSNGAYLYATTDLATIYERIKTYNPDYILYVTDDRQRMHFEQIFRVCKNAGLANPPIFEHNYFGTINGVDGKPFKTRSGDLLKLNDLIKEVRDKFLSIKETNKDMVEEDIIKIVNSILKYADLQNNREKNYIFDLNKFSDTVGKTGPYTLYTAIRIRKILKDNNYSGGDIKLESLNKEERNLKLSILNKNNSILKATNDRMPHFIADYIYELCTNVNAFYQVNNIMTEKNIKRKNEWLELLNKSYTILDEMLYLLGIEIPSKM